MLTHLTDHEVWLDAVVGNHNFGGVAFPESDRFCMEHGNSEAQDDNWENDAALQIFEMERTCVVDSDSFELNAHLLVSWDWKNCMVFEVGLKIEQSRAYDPQLND